MFALGAAISDPTNEDREGRTMTNGTVRWFNRNTGAGFIRTDDGENVFFQNGSVRASDPGSIYNGARVSLDVLKGKYGLTGVNVRITGPPERQG